MNHEFRQTGLQWNEWRLAGVADFKKYDKGLDLELSNIAELGFRRGLPGRPHIPPCQQWDRSHCQGLVLK